MNEISESVCKVCAGKGQKPCTACGGTGTERHDLCKGSGTHPLDPGDCSGCDDKNGWRELRGNFVVLQMSVVRREGRVPWILYSIGSGSLGLSSSPC